MGSFLKHDEEGARVSHTQDWRLEYFGNRTKLQYPMFLHVENWSKIS